MVHIKPLVGTSHWPDIHLSVTDPRFISDRLDSSRISVLDSLVNISFWIEMFLIIPRYAEHKNAKLLFFP